MVLIVMALVIILVTVVMSMTLVNYRMKYTNAGAQNNFYTAESALAELRMGLAEDVSKASSEAYSSVMENFALLDEAGRTAKFRSEFTKSIKNEIQYNAVSGTYSLDYLKSLLKESGYDDTYKVGAKISATPAGTNIVNETTDGVVLKDVTVLYQGQDDYVSSIRTDIVLNFPEIDFSQTAEMPELPSFSLITSKRFVVTENQNCIIYGNAYLGTEANETRTGAKLTVKKNSESYGRELLISGASVGATDNSKLEISGMEVWADNFVVDSSHANVTDAALYLKNDLVVANSRSVSTGVKIGGELYGYGNIGTAVLASAVSGDSTKEDFILKNPDRYSSSVIVNGTGSESEALSLDLTGLTVMKVAGNSYINGKKEKGIVGGTAESYDEINKENVLMGESVSTRTSQVAYLVPGDCIAPGLENGGTNPMPVAQYSKLMQELTDTYGASDAEGKLVDLDVTSAKQKSTLRALGVTGWQLEAHQIAKIGSMVYVFMKFDTEESASNYFERYYSAIGGAKLEGYLDQTYVNIKMPKDAPAASNASFYLNGSVLAGDNAKVMLPSRRQTLTAEEEQVLKEEEISYQDSYEALQHKLMKSYDKLSESEKTKSIYENLVNEFVSGTNTDYSIPSNGQKHFVKSTGEAAVIVNGDYVVNAENMAKFKNDLDMEGNQHADAKCHVVIASGNVTVSCDFRGLILAKGTITVDQNVTITSDNKAVSLALMAGDQKGIHAYDYLVNGKSYCIAGSEEGVDVDSYTGGVLDMVDYVTYENWTKR